MSLALPAGSPAPSRKPAGPIWFRNFTLNAKKPLEERFFAAIMTAALLGCESSERTPGHSSVHESRLPAIRSDRGGSQSTGASGTETQVERVSTNSEPTNTAASSDTARGNKSEPGAPEKLYGTWVANDVDAKIGEVKIKLTFREEGTMKIAAWSELPLVGQVRDLKGPYEVQGDTISSKAIRGGTAAKYWFEGEQLVLQFEDGKTVRFQRE